MNILITGAAGFIGSNLVDYLVQRTNHVITAVDNFDSFYSRKTKEQNIATFKLNARCSFIEADICDIHLERHFADKKLDVVIHLAAKAGVRPSMHQAASYIQTNIQGTQNLLDLAVKYGVRHFVFASSSSVYGENPNVPWVETEPDLQFISPYAYTKISGEQLGKLYTHMHGMAFTALRFFAVYGPRQRPDLGIYKFFESISENSPVKVFGDGSAIRDFTYIDNIVEGIVKAVERDAQGFEIFNLGNHEPVSVNALIQAIEKVIGIKATIEYGQTAPGDVPMTYANIDKAAKILGYQPSVHLEDGLTRFYKWFKEMKQI